MRWRDCKPASEQPPSRVQTARFANHSTSFVIATKSHFPEDEFCQLYVTGPDDPEGVTNH
jgi:hypothetical protein